MTCTQRRKKVIVGKICKIRISLENLKMKCEKEKKWQKRSSLFYVSLHERIEYNKLSTLIDFLVSDGTEQVSYEKKSASKVASFQQSKPYLRNVVTKSDHRDRVTT